jgi:four helix bundle protein
VFHLADGLVVAIYAATRTFPADEVFGLSSQVRRAGVSVAANLVEGCGCHSDREYLRYLRCAFSSLREVGYLIDLASRLGYLGQLEARRLNGRQRRTAAALGALIRSVAA